MRRNLPYLLAYLLFALLYFHKVFIEGMLVAPGDGMGLYYPKHLLTARLAGESLLELWNPFLFSGFPFMASIESAVLYPPNWAALLLPATAAYNALAIAHYTGAAFFTFLFARLIGAKEFPAFLAGLVFAFLGFFGFSVPFVTFYATLMWFPLVLYFLERTRRGQGLRDAVLSGLVLGVMLLAGHPQMAFNILLVAGLFVVYHAFYLGRGKRLRFVGLSASALALGALVALPQLAATMELIRLSPRADVTYKFFTAFSYPPHMLPSSIFPFLWGRGYSGGPYWGPFTDYTDTQAYFGVLPLVIALVSAVAMRRNLHARFFALVGTLGLILSMGGYTPLYRLLYHLPVFSYFRAPARHMVEVSMAVSMLFALGLTGYLSEGRRGIGRAALAALLALSALALVLLVPLGPALQGFVLSRIGPMRPQATAAALSLKSPAIYVPLVFMAASAAWLIAMKARGGLSWVRYSLAALVMAEALVIGSVVVAGPKAADVEKICEEGAIGFLSGKGGGRVAFLHERLQPLQGAMCGLMMVDGFEQLVNRDYNDILGLETSGSYTDWSVTALNNPALSMMATRYIVVSPGMEGFVSGVRGRVAVGGTRIQNFVPPFAYLPYPYGDFISPVYRKVYSDPSGSAVYENLNAMPLAYSVPAIRPVSGTGEAIKIAKGGSFDPRREALVMAEDVKDIGRAAFSSADVGVKRYGAGSVELESSSEGPAFVVLSEQHYPGWKAYVDGGEARLYKVDAVLKGVAVPPGRHSITFLYRPWWIYGAFVVSALALAAAIAALLTIKGGSFTTAERLAGSQ